MEHKFKESRFEPDGEINGFRCPVQEYKCKNCGLVVELPMGTNINDYNHGDCKDVTHESKVVRKDSRS